MRRDDAVPRASVHGPLATPEAIAGEPVPFPSVTSEAPLESGFADWRRRLTGNLSRRSDGRWDPLTRIHGPEGRPDAEVAEERRPPGHS
jgi:hypothetical protein